MRIKNKIFRNITANYFGIAGHILIAFIMSPFLVHTLGDARYGIWTVITAFSGYMSLLDLGISAALTRYIARHYKQGNFDVINRYINSTLLLFVLISIVIISSSALFSGFIAKTILVDESLKDTLQLLIIIISLDISLFVIAGIFRGAFSGFQDFGVINIATLGGAIFKAIIWYFLLSKGHGLISMGWVAVFASVLIILFYYYYLIKIYRFTSFGLKHIRKKQVSSVFHFSKYVFIAMVANQILNYSSPFIIGTMLSASAVTYYSIPWALAEHVKQLGFAISRVYTPAFSELQAEKNEKRLYKSYLAGTRVMLVFSNLFCAGMLVLGGDFIGVWIGERYQVEAEPIVIILFVTFYFYAPQLISVSLLQGMAINKRYAQASVVIAVVSLVMSVILARTHGLVGVALGAAIPQIAFSGLVVPWYVNRVIFNQSLGSFFANTHIKALLPGVCLFVMLQMAELVWHPDSYLIIFLEAIGCTSIYVFLVYKMFLDENEKHLINVFFRLPGSDSLN